MASQSALVTFLGTIWSLWADFLIWIGNDISYRYNLFEITIAMVVVGAVVYVVAQKAFEKLEFEEEMSNRLSIILALATVFLMVRTGLILLAVGYFWFFIIGAFIVFIYFGYAMLHRGYSMGREIHAESLENLAGAKEQYYEALKKKKEAELDYKKWKATEYAKLKKEVKNLSTYRSWLRNFSNRLSDIRARKGDEVASNYAERVSPAVKNALRKIAKGISSVYSSAKKFKAHLKSAPQAAKGFLKKLKSQEKDLNEDLRKLMDEINKLKKEIDQKNVNINMLLNRINQLESKLAEVQNEYTQYLATATRAVQSSISNLPEGAKSPALMPPKYKGLPGGNYPGLPPAKGYPGGVLASTSKKEVQAFESAKELQEVYTKASALIKKGNVKKALQLLSRNKEILSKPEVENTLFKPLRFNYVREVKKALKENNTKKLSKFLKKFRSLESTPAGKELLYPIKNDKDIARMFKEYLFQMIGYNLRDEASDEYVKVLKSFLSWMGKKDIIKNFDKANKEEKERILKENKRDRRVI